jgi:putative protease
MVSANAFIRSRMKGGVVRNDIPFPERELSYLGNVLNRDAEAFYRRHGVGRIEPAAESGLQMSGRKVMTTRYCVKHQLGLCGYSLPEPLALIDEQGRRLELDFDCAECEMSVFLDRRPQ